MFSGTLVGGTEGELTLVAVDAYGNRLTDTAAVTTVMAVSVSGPAAASSSVTNLGDGTYSVGRCRLTRG